MMRRRRGLVSNMNVVPYIDVMLVLLVIFMVTAPMLQQGVAVDLPKATAKPLPTQKNEPIVISVDARGAYYLNVAEKPSEPIDGRAMAIQVARLVQRDASLRVLIKGDKQVPYGSVMQAMVLLQHAGVDNVGLITEPPSGKR